MSYDPLSTGPSGYSGESGVSGYSGSVGGPGTSGYSGYSGNTALATDHSTLSNLSYAAANHTGFQPTLIWDTDYYAYLIP